MKKAMVTKAVSMLTKGNPMNQSMLAPERGVAAASPPVRDKLNRQRRALPPAGGDGAADDDARVWDIMGRVVFSAGSGKAPAPPLRDQLTSHRQPQPAAGGDGEADDDSRVWDIMGRVVFSAD